jgi:hypothetical protein
VLVVYALIGSIAWLQLFARISRVPEYAAEVALRANVEIFLKPGIELQKGFVQASSRIR